MFMTKKKHEEILYKETGRFYNIGHEIGASSELFKVDKDNDSLRKENRRLKKELNEFRKEKANKNRLYRVIIKNLTGHQRIDIWLNKEQYKAFELFSSMSKEKANYVNDPFMVLYEVLWNENN